METEPSIIGERRSKEIQKQQEIAKSRWTRPVMDGYQSLFEILPTGYHYFVTQTILLPQWLLDFELLPYQLNYRGSVSKPISILLDLEKLALAQMYHSIMSSINKIRTNPGYSEKKDLSYSQIIQYAQSYLLKLSQRCWKIYIEEVDIHGGAETFYFEKISLDYSYYRNIVMNVFNRGTFLKYPALHMILFWTKDIFATDTEVIASATYYFHEGLRFLVDLERHMLERAVTVRRATLDQQDLTLEPLMVCEDIFKKPALVKGYSFLTGDYDKYYCKKCNNFPISEEFYCWHRVLYHTGFTEVHDLMSPETVSLVKRMVMKHLQDKENKNVGENCKSLFVET